MILETWLALAATSAVLLFIPGPTVLLMVSYALGQGWRPVLPLVAGILLGDVTAMTLSLLGVGALLAASATLFTVLKWTGAAYLAWLGLKLWKASGTLEARPCTEASSSARMFGHGWIVTALNPKSVTFFIAFLPQFFDHRSAFLPQLLITEATFLTLAFCSLITYTFIATRARRFMHNAKTISAINKTSGTLLIAAAVASATLQTTART
ncbi:LysE family translocator [Paralcaligenes sp. KSB-10]|jgi:threonine/homoserine/homoserine lactone efflux protein|uniref:LysE family translocator n=1 Tax=Paralcaligenes sp. KSB-10 TaxID=2901142 RepID=UPI001E324691|nr:LysE family translocator [Paralcaligenes sp. KSB-10]UHL64485.1 LysE family translocator [Paralcaligenes sp. KSB-10]